MADFEVLVTPDGQPRVLNLLPSPPALRAAMPKTRGAGRPLSELKPAFFRPKWLAIKDQNGRGACVGHGSVRGVEAVRALAGQDGGVEGRWLELSAWDCYARLCGGIDRGANILESLKLLESEGVATMASVPYGTINPRRISEQAKSERSRCKVEIGEELSSFEEMIWEVARGNAVVYSVKAGWGAFNSVDPEGHPGVAWGQSDHCVVGYGEIGHSSKWGWWFGSDNSWNEGWGKQGRFICSDALIQHQGGFEAYSLRAIFNDPTGDFRPPPAPIA